MNERKLDYNKTIQALTLPKVVPDTNPYRSSSGKREAFLCMSPNEQGLCRTKGSAQRRRDWDGFFELVDIKRGCVSFCVRMALTHTIFQLNHNLGEI